MQIKTVEPERPWNIEIVTTKTQEYLLLTRTEPLALTVKGPTSLRVYTRILLPSRATGGHLYKLILAESPTEERIISFETTLSTITTDSHGTPVSKWRSFYIDVPEGESNYTLTHWSSPKDTILVRFAYESPQPWTIVPATEYRSLLETIEDGVTKRYYELQKNERVVIQIAGPARIRIITRLSYDETLFGEQSFTLIARDNGNETTFPIKCDKSDDLTYQNRSDIVPSTSRSVYLSLDQGIHTVEFEISGTLARSIALRFEKEP
jgi:hypothetical protein